MESGNELMIIGGSIVGILVLAFILRWIFSVSRIVRELETQRKLLAKLCENNGMDKSEIEELNKYANTNEIW